MPAGSTCPSHAAARLLRVEDDRVEVDLLHEPTANLLRLSDASHRSGPWALTTSVAQLSSDSLADEELCALRPGALFVDAGANIGSCSLLMLHLGIPTVSFEPLPSNLYYLTASVLANAGFASRLTLYGVALGDPRGPARAVSRPRRARLTSAQAGPRGALSSCTVASPSTACSAMYGSYSPATAPRTDASGCSSRRTGRL